MISSQYVILYVKMETLGEGKTKDSLGLVFTPFWIFESHRIALKTTIFCVFRSKKATLSEQTGRPFGVK
jgi:hypothetical protein